MVNITTATQLSIFSTLQTVLLNSSVLSIKFNTKNIIEFEPTSLKHQSLPYISIRLPSTVQDIATLNRVLVNKSFNLTASLVMDWTARSNLLNYCNAIITQIESSSSEFSVLGYDNVECNLLRTDTESIDDINIVVGEFEITFDGTVSR